MGVFARRRGRHDIVSRHLRLRASFWTSAGIVALLLVLQVSWQWVSSEDDLSAKPRRLISDVYPDDLLLTKPYYDDPNRWLVLVHCIGIGYMLIGLNTVCDIFFTGALDVMVDEWNIKPDVAGATFMAAGGSMPELFTSLIGVAVESDVGFSTIVGSAVFNVLFVIGLCGYAAKEDMKLTWWPLFRDCSYYIVSLFVLAMFCYDRKVVLHEAVLLFAGYLMYCILMYNNSKLERWVSAAVRKQGKQVVPAETVTSGGDQAVDEIKDVKNPTNKVQDEEKEKGDPPEATPEATPEVKEGSENGSQTEEDDAIQEFISNFTKPEDEASARDLIIWYISCPVYMLLYYCIPRPSKKWFIASFLLSLAWIAAFAFVLVWCVEILGDVIFRGDNAASVVMGFTILAAGTSIPDAVSSVAVAIKGEGDMAVSSSIGSNIFDILFGLPVPWIIKIAIKLGGSDYVSITSPFIFFYVLLLLFMVFLTVLSIHLVGWKLNNTLGLCMAGLYGVFLVIALTVEFSKPAWLKWT